MFAKNLLDGAELGQLIAGSPADPDAALAAYETALFKRSAASAAESAASMDMMFGDNALEGLLSLFAGR